MTDAMSRQTTIEEKRRALLALRLRQKRAAEAGADRIRPVPRDGRALVPSYQQEGLWFLHQMEPGSPVYNVPFALRLRGPLDIGALREAFRLLVARHEALRTRFPGDGGEPRLVVEDAPASWPLPVTDLSDLPESAREEFIRNRAQEEAVRPFDLATGPLLRTGLLRLSDTDHVLLMSLHHVVTDGWSTGIIVQDLATFYDGGQLPALDLRTADFAAWQRERLTGAAMEGQLSYWRRTLADLPVVDFPSDRPRPVEPTSSGATLEASLPRELGEGLRALARTEGASLLAVLQAGLLTVLSRYTGQDDLAIGSVFSGRTRSEVESLVGLFANTLVLRTSTAGDPSFRELVGRCKETVLGALDHQDVPFTMVVDALKPERVPGRNPLFQISLTLQAAGTSGRGFALPGVEAQPLASHEISSRFDVGVTVIETPEGGLDVVIEYATELFDRARMERLAGHFRTVLEQAVTAPDSMLGELEILDAAEREQLLWGWNPEPVTREEDGSLLHELVERWAAADASAPAMRFEGTELSYGELDTEANRLSHLLRADFGLGPDMVAGVLLERGTRLPVAQLAVLKAGGAWLPLDPQYPAERLAGQLADAGTRVVVTTLALSAALSADMPRVCLDEPATARRLARTPDSPLPGGTTPDNLAYLIYTSGSTGAPKGVMVSHRAAVNFVLNARELFGIGPGDRLLQFANPAFDVSVFDFYGALGSGATVVGASREVLLDPDALQALMARERVSVADVPPAVLRLLDPGPLSDLRALFVGLEAFPAELVNRWSSAKREFHNGYGPTEATVACVDYPCPPGGLTASPPIGRAMANHRAYILHGGTFEPMPVGVPGELFIAGAGLARGYLGRPDLTAERFVPDPFSGSGERMYRTGDVVRWREDGNLEFLGRADRQIKIRGLRIEPGEIEHALAGCEGVRQGTVVVHDSGTPAARLIGYVVPTAAGAADTDGIRAALTDRLPLHMVPAQVIVIDALPLTPSGKLDRARLPAPRTAAESRNEPPRTATERALADIWHTLLDVPLESIGALDGFFDLGGNSLHATRLTSRIRDTFHVSLAPRVLFTHSVLRDLAARVDQAHTAAPAGQDGAVDDTDRIRPVPRDGRPLVPSYQQEGLWFLHQLDPESPVYNMPFALRLRGPLDVGALREAFRRLVGRHEALRTRFSGEGEEPRLIVDEAPASWPLPVTDLTGLPEPDREERVRQLMDAAAVRAFDLAAGPLLRTELLRLADTDHVLLMNLHHVVTDGWSTGIIGQELSALHAGTDLPPLAVQVADFAAWQRERLTGEVLEGQLSYWRRTLADLPVVDFPSDRSRPVEPTSSGATLEASLPRELGEGLRALARMEGASLLAVLQAGLLTVLSRYTGQDDLAIGSVFSGRTRSEVEPLVGLFANTLVLRTSTAGDPSFRELVGRCKETVLGALDHQDVPFTMVVDALKPERVPGRNPLFQISLTLQAADASDAPFRFGSTTGEYVGTTGTRARFDLAVSASETADGGIALQLEYATELYDHDRVERLVDHFRTVLEQAVRTPDAPIGGLTLLTARERRQMTDWSTARETYPADVSLYALFAEQVRLRPGAVAVVDGATRLTYRELDAHAGRLAARLRERGVRRGDLVGLCGTRSAALVAGVLAILRAGGAYVPLDPGHPAERLGYMIEDSGIGVLLADSAAELPDGPYERVPLDVGHPADGDPVPEPVTVGGDDLAYLIYTSGSTGRPKAVMIPHRNVVRLLRSTHAWFGFDERDVWSLFHSFAFDFSVWELWGALAHGGRLVVVPYWESRSPEAFYELLERERVTVLNQTPAAFRQLVAVDEERGADLALRTVVFGGDALDVDAVLRWFDRHGEDAPLLVNMYGITETTVHVTYSPLTRELLTRSPGPIGVPIPDLSVWVVDRAGQLAPAGVPGEMWVGGPGVAWGYLGRPDLTAERFVPDPFGGGAGRLYRSGDLARRLSDGTLEYLGRIDQQVKIRGFRVEPGEIDAALAGHPEVTDAFTTVHGTGDGRRLIGYVVPAPGAGPDLSARLRAHAGTELPDYMVPAVVVPLERIPLTDNGKVDRKALPAPELTAGARFVAPRTPTERALAALWARVLDATRVGALDGFFDLGGSSLDLIRLRFAVRESFGALLDVRALYAAPTVEAMARAIDARTPAAPVARTGAGATPLVTLRAEGGRPPLFLVHAVGGAVVPYVPLARLLDADTPVHALEHPGLHDGAHRTAPDLGALADTYLAAVRRACPAGPYHLGGWSLGGAIALEMAARLRAAGAEVASVTLLDTGFPPQAAEAPGEAELLAAFVRDLAGLRGAEAPAADLERPAAATADDRTAELLALLERTGLIPTGVRDEVRTRVAVFLANSRAYHTHRPTPYDGPITLLSAGAELDDQVDRWRAFATGGLDHHVVPGTHHTMLQHPHLPALARTLRRVLGHEK
ncbi:amino acid adenylation domain-containing protein [Streptomyces albireticuli]|uniref:amino acid adenylation domain-containing protein n=1 Tax=Streptomyces albireticuli TaxID=1940 RepID=UPI00368F5A8A